MDTNDESPDPTLETEEDVRSSAQPGTPVVSVKGLTESWLKWSSEHQENQKLNPFSHDTKAGVTIPQRGQGGYGKPQQGSLTEQRGMEAQTHISREVQELCEVIRNIGDKGNWGGSGRVRNVTTVEFGKLFEHYVSISNKLVGILLRARKQGLVDFEGEMLWQGKDDHIVITLVHNNQH